MGKTKDALIKLGAVHSEDEDRWSCAGHRTQWLSETDEEYLGWLKGYRDCLRNQGRAINAIIDERRRQIGEEGWSREHDDSHTDFQLGKAAIAYLQIAVMKDRTRKQAVKRDFAPGVWPWSFRFWKPKDRRRDLERAGALVVAELERVIRAAEKAGAA